MKTVWTFPKISPRTKLTLACDHIPASLLRALKTVINIKWAIYVLYQFILAASSLYIQSQVEGAGSWRMAVILCVIARWRTGDISASLRPAASVMCFHCAIAHPHVSSWRMVSVFHVFNSWTLFFKWPLEIFSAYYWCERNDRAWLYPKKNC
jgi:hypothetical protein